MSIKDVYKCCNFKEIHNIECHKTEDGGYWEDGYVIDSGQRENTWLLNIFIVSYISVLWSYRLDFICIIFNYKRVIFKVFAGSKISAICKVEFIGQI